MTGLDVHVPPQAGRPLPPNAGALSTASTVRPKGGDAAWARVTKEMDLCEQVIAQAGIPNL
jgi:hypothetical protein